MNVARSKFPTLLASVTCYYILLAHQGFGSDHDLSHRDQIHKICYPILSDSTCLSDPDAVSEIDPIDPYVSDHYLDIDKKYYDMAQQSCDRSFYMRGVGALALASASYWGPSLISTYFPAVLSTRPNLTASMLFIGSMIQPAFRDAYGYVAKTLVETYQRYVNGHKIHDPFLDFYAVKNYYQDIKPRITDKNYIKRIESLISQVEEVLAPKKNILQLDFFVSGDKNGKNDKVLATLDRIVAILEIYELSKKEKSTTYRWEREKEDEYNDFMSSYPEGVKSQINRLRDEIVKGYSGERYSSRSYLLLGVPGSGKTRLVNKLGEIFQMPVAKVDASKLMSTSTSIFGESNSSPSKNEGGLSLFTQAIRDLAKDKHLGDSPYGIIFFDEIDKVSNRDISSAIWTKFLDLLDSAKKKVYLDDLGVYIDNTRLIYIFATNDVIDNAPVNSRLRTVYFPQVDLNQRARLVCQRFKIMLNSKTDGRVCAPSSSEIAPVARDLASYIIGEREQHPGLRHIFKIVEDYAGDYLTHQLYGLSEEYIDSELRSRNFGTTWDPVTEYEKIRSKYREEKSSLSDNVSEAIQGILDGIKHGFSANLSDRDKENIKAKISTAQTILKLPRHIIRLDRKSIMKELDMVLSTYDDTVASDVKKAVDLHIANSLVAEKQGDNVVKRAYYFYGGPGVGKSHLAYKIGKATGLPIIDASSIGEIKQGRSMGSFFEPREPEFSNFAQSLLSKGKEPYPRNAILMIDEIDKSSERFQRIQTFLLRLTDAGQNTVNLPELGIDFDIHLHFILLIGNALLPSAPTMDRMTVIKFPPVSKRNMRRIAFQRVKSRMHYFDNEMRVSFAKFLDNFFEASDPQSNPDSLRRLLQMSNSWATLHEWDQQVASCPADLKEMALVALPTEEEDEEPLDLDSQATCPTLANKQLLP